MTTKCSITVDHSTFIHNVHKFNSVQWKMSSTQMELPVFVSNPVPMKRQLKPHSKSTSFSGSRPWKKPNKYKLKLIWKSYHIQIQSHTAAYHEPIHSWASEHSLKSAISESGELLPLRSLYVSLPTESLVSCKTQIMKDFVRGLCWRKSS